jgi:hypothetical protein
MIDFRARLTQHTSIPTQERHALLTAHEALLDGRITAGFTALESIPGAVLPDSRTGETLQTAIHQTINVILKVGR